MDNLPDQTVLTDLVKVKMPFGKYTGVELTDIPYPYLKWAVRNCDLNEELRWAITCILRGKLPPPSMEERVKQIIRPH